jgi:hypothetical protein
MKTAVCTISVATTTTTVKQRKRKKKGRGQAVESFSNDLSRDLRIKPACIIGSNSPPSHKRLLSE